MSAQRWPRAIFRLVFRLLPVALLALAIYWVRPALEVLRANINNLECYCPSCPEDLLTETGYSQLGLIKVDVAGAVNRPGIYQLALGSRQADLVEAAGGLDDQASLVFLAKTFNLSQALADGDKVYIPYTWEEDWQLTAVAQPAASQADDPQDQSPATTGTLISINQATSSQLQSLNGVGEKRAEDIIAGRPYSQLSDLLDQGIIGDSLFQDIQDLISL